MSNAYCDVLGIAVPAVDDVVGHAEASPYSLLIVALMEQGGPMTLPQVADRFERAGFAAAGAALDSLKRCRPARAPVYRDGDLYALDPHDHDTDLWAFRLGLRPPRGAPIARPEPPEPAPPPGPDVPLTIAEMDEAWREAGLHSWSAQRVAVSVLDAHPESMAPDDVVAFVTKRTQWHSLSVRAGEHWRRGAAVQVLEGGRWAIVPDHPWVRSARQAVRDRLVLVRRWAGMRTDPAEMEENRRAWEKRRAVHETELGRLRRVLVHAFPAGSPQAVVVVDIASRELTTYGPHELDRVRERLDEYDLTAALDVRPLLRALGFDPGTRPLADLGPPQKSKQLNRRGRTLKITTPLLVWGSCRIGRPFGDEKRLRSHLAAGETTKLHRRLEADAKALVAYYQYGRLHHTVRLRWGFLDEMIAAPWVDRDERSLHGLVRAAFDGGRELEVVSGSAPGWKDPRARARRCRVLSDGSPYGRRLVDEEGLPVDDRDVQLARLRTTYDLRWTPPRSRDELHER